MKAVLLPIQPYYVFLIIARIKGWNIPQEKTVEVRKDYPKDSAWSKVTHIYCSKNRKSFNRIPAQYQPFMEKLLGKVIGEFVCDRIDEQIVFHKGITRIMIQGYKENLFALCKSAQLSLDELHDYIDKDGEDLEIVYGWHISDLKIYDKPKELGEFEYRQYPRRGGMGWWLCAVLCPPQSWRYVEG